MRTGYRYDVTMLELINIQTRNKNYKIKVAYEKVMEYDDLHASKQLEQEITKDLKSAFEKRGFKIRHKGTATTHAPAGYPDIELWDTKIHINVEVTKSTKSYQDREWQSIKDHFEKTRKNNSNKKCFLLFVSPDTYYRTINSIKDWNFAHKNSNDQKIMPIYFHAFKKLVTKLKQTSKEKYTKKDIVGVFDSFENFNDDQSILRHLHEKLFVSDKELKKEVEDKEEERHQRVVEELIIGFKQLEQKLRDERIAISTSAIKTVIYLVFIKLYEERKEQVDREKNRFTLTSFRDYQKNIRNENTAIHKLFDSIKNDPEIKSSKLLTDDDKLIDRLKDDFVINHFIKPFEQYTFHTAKVDGLGAAYEVLGQLSGKDTRVGQFFTPENVVEFMVKLAELEPEDVVFDPACGTARFLTNAMNNMIEKAKGKRDQVTKIKHIKSDQLHGVDDDPTVSKLAKMNMYIHGDGKTNVQDQDGLTQYVQDDKIDVILTNPPLGKLDYWRSLYDDDFRINRLVVIPKKNQTQEKLDKINKRITKLKDTKKIKIMEELTKKKFDLENKIQYGKEEYEVTGKSMKGGALFLNACKHYLKNIRNESQDEEWSGGKVLIVIDEGILNTHTYKEVREFIKKNFFIKAIISLTTDTFVPVSNTNTKTSILYAIKKDDTDVVQTEPIFFAHAEKVGLNTRKKICPNNLINNSDDDILSKYFKFKTAIINSYVDQSFDKKKFLKQKIILDGKNMVKPTMFYRFFDEITYRLDENFNNPVFDELNDIVLSSPNIISLGDPIIQKTITSGTTPKNLQQSEDLDIPFIGSSSIYDEKIDISIAPRIQKHIHETKLKNSKLQKGDMLITMAGTIGRCAIFDLDIECNVNQAVAILRINEEKIIPRFLLKYLNSRIGQLYFRKLQHVSGQPNINLEEIKNIKIVVPDKDKQKAILKRMDDIEKKAKILHDKYLVKIKTSMSLFENSII